MSSPAGPAVDRQLPATGLGDRRGLSAVGAVALALILGLAGGAFDVITGPGLRGAFAVSFITGSVLAALLVRRESLRVAVVMPPLVYVVLALAGGAMETAGEPGSLLTQQAMELVTALVLRAPVLLIATALALAIGLVRARRER